MLLGTNVTRIPAALGEIVRGAFDPAAVTGGVVGGMIVAMQKGIARGIFPTNRALVLRRLLPLLLRRKNRFARASSP